MLAVGQPNASERHFVERADGFAEHRVGGVADLAVGHDVIGTHKIEVVDLQARHELVDLDGPRGFQRAVKPIARDLDIGIGGRRGSRSRPPACSRRAPASAANTRSPMRRVFSALWPMTTTNIRCPVDAGGARAAVRAEDAAVPAAGLGARLPCDQSARHHPASARRRYAHDRKRGDCALSRHPLRADAVERGRGQAGLRRFSQLAAFRQGSADVPADAGAAVH